MKTILYPTCHDDLVYIMRDSRDSDKTLTVIGGETTFKKKSSEDSNKNWVSLRDFPDEIRLFPDDLTMIVPAGLSVDKVEKYLARHGFFLPIDIAGDSDRVTIGGLAATNARCLRTARYGTLRNYILGMDIVNSRGEKMRVGGMTIKNVAGYDIAQFLIGSWGEMALITHLIFKLIPFPKTIETLQIKFDTDLSAIQAMQSISDRLIIPSRFEWICAPSSLLLIEIDNSPEDTAMCQSICEEKGGSSKLVRNFEEQQSIWRTRRSLLRKILQKEQEAVLLTLQVTADAKEFLSAMKRERDISEKFYLFGHCNEKIWHIILPRKQAIPKRIARLADLGHIREEVGIGYTHSRVTENSESKCKVDIQNRIKNAFDPYCLFQSR